MRAHFPLKSTLSGFFLLALIACIAGPAEAQDAPAASATAFVQDDWLKPANSGETFKATTGQDVTDPFVVLSTGSLWQDKYGEVYTRRLDDTLSLSCETDKDALVDEFEQLSASQKVGFLFRPADAFTLRGDLHDVVNDAYLPGNSTTASGATLSAETHLPTKSEVTLGFSSDDTVIDAPSGLETHTDACDAQIKQPIGQTPFSAILKSHYEETYQGQQPTTSLPSLEQSLQWKPAQNTTLQMGLRQQQYQEYPGVDHELNEALFADWSQKVVDNVSWHSYAEVLNSHGLLNQAPASPIAPGGNGTPQANTPGSNASPTSSLPISIDDQALTFSTGPSVQVQKDISARLEYSDRWDKNPAVGNVGQEQRISISVKGTF